MKKKILSAVLASVSLYNLGYFYDIMRKQRESMYRLKSVCCAGTHRAKRLLPGQAYLKSLSAEMGVEIDFSTELNSADEELAAVAELCVSRL